MKRKIVIIIAAVFLFFSGYVIAEVVDGNYMDNRKVKIFFENNELTSKEVPAYVKDGKTLAPISLLQNSDDKLVEVKRKALPYLNGAYTRSMSIIDGHMFFVPGGGQISEVEYKIFPLTLGVLTKYLML